METQKLTLLLLLLLSNSISVAKAQLLGPASVSTLVKANVVFPAGGGGETTPEFVGFTLGESGSAQLRTITRTTTTGNVLVIGATWEDEAQTPTVSDTSGNTYTTIVQTNSSGVMFSWIAYAKNITGKASEVITIDFGDSAPFTATGAWEFTDVSASEPLDAFSHGTGTGTTAVTSDLSSGQDVVALVSLMKNYSGVAGSPQTDWTEDADGASGTHFSHRITSTQGNYHGGCTWASSQEYSGTVGSFK